MKSSASDKSYQNLSEAYYFTLSACSLASEYADWVESSVSDKFYQNLSEADDFVSEILRYQNIVILGIVH